MTVFSFDSFEEMTEHLDRQREAANSRLHEKQQAITYGDYVFGIDHDIIYWGQVWTLTETETSEREAGASEKEIAYTIDSTKQMHEDGLLFGRYFSVAEPTGELGSNHRLNLWPTSREVFEAAQAFGWDWDQLPIEQLREFKAQVSAFITHRQEVG